MNLRSLQSGLSRVLIILLTLPSFSAEGKSFRDPKVRAEFMLSHPCPSTGKTRGACPGFQVDHRWPICFHDGPDEPWNLQWLTVTAHRAKTALDVKVCKWDGK